MGTEISPNRSTTQDSAAVGLREKIVALADEAHTGSINHINTESLCYSPIAISIETKTEGRTIEEAKVQLAIYVASLVFRLRALFGSSSDEVICRMVFPMIVVQTSEWHLMFARLPNATALGAERLVGNSLVFMLNCPLTKPGNPLVYSSRGDCWGR